MPAMVWEMMLWWVQGCLWLLSAAGDAPACRACCRRLSVYGMQDQGVLSIPRLLKPWQHHCGAATALSDAASALWHALQANNCAKILDNLLRQDLGINAGSCFNHAVRAANGVLPQASGWTVAMPSNQTAMLNTNSCLICFAQLFSRQLPTAPSAWDTHLFAECCSRHRLCAAAAQRCDAHIGRLLPAGKLMEAVGGTAAVRMAGLCVRLQGAGQHC